MEEEKFIDCKELKTILERFGKIKKSSRKRLTEPIDIEELCKYDLFDCKDWNENSYNYPYIKLNGEIYQRDNIYFDRREICHDCNILNKKGNYHHFGCDMERCPRCKKQLISCDCFIEGIFKTKPKSNIFKK